MKKDIPLISVGFDGYNLDDTLKGFQCTGSSNICLCALDEFTQHVLPEKMTDEEWVQTKELFERYGLKLYGLEGHCDVSDASNMEKIRRRTEFTRFMGGRYIDMSAGPKGSEEGFYKQIEFISDLAEEMNIIFCLETHGDMIDSGKTGSRILKKVKSERVRLCYDPANIYFYSKGKLNPHKDVKYALEYTALIHFKGVSHNRDKTVWFFPLMKDAIFDYPEFFHILQNSGYDKMVAIEVEKMFRYEGDKEFIREPGWSMDDIIEAYTQEIDYLGKQLEER